MGSLGGIRARSRTASAPSRVGSVVNVVICGFLAASTLSSGFARDLLGIAPLLGMEAIFIGIAVRVWWRGRIRLDEND